MTGYSADLKTPLGRLTYPSLFKPTSIEEGGKLRFQATLLFPKDVDISVLKAAAAEAAANEWGEKAKNLPIRSPFLDGDGPQGVSKKTGERHNGYAGMTFIRLSATPERPPKIFNALVMPAIEGATSVKEGPYSGCYVYAVVNAYTWDDPRNGKGVSFGFSMIQSAKDGEVLGRAPPSADRFLEKIEDTGGAPASTGNGQGAAGLFS